VHCLRNGMAARDGGDAAEEVEILAARPVVDVLPLAAPDLDRFGVAQADAREKTLLVAADEIGCVVRQLGRGNVGSAEQVGHGVSLLRASRRSSQDTRSPDLTPDGARGVVLSACGND